MTALSSTKRTERVLLGAAFTLAASNSVVFALMGNLQDVYGFGDAGLGFIAAAGFLASFVVQVTIAPLADRGRARHLLIAGTILAVIGNLVFALGSSLAVFVLARAIAGSASGCFLPPARALMASLDTERVSERLGALGGIELAGFVTGPVIGGLLVGPFGLRLPFIVFACSALIATVIVSTQHLPTLTWMAGTQRLAFGLLRHRSVLVPILFLVSLALPVGLYDSLWDRFLTDLGASDTLVGVSLAVYAIPFVLLSRAGGRLADRRGQVGIAFMAVIVVAPLTALYGVFTSPFLPITIGVIESCAQAGGAPAAQGLLARGAPPGRAGAAQGLAGACTQLVAAVVAMLATWGNGYLSAPELFTIAGISVLIMGTVARVLARDLDRSEPVLS
ncbi:MAG: MFS transporter [Actinomycetota bacterium]